MIAINKASGAKFEVLDNLKKNFVGKVISDESGLWKIGQICYQLNKSQFMILMEWDEMETLKRQFDAVTKLMKKML